MIDSKLRQETLQRFTYDRLVAPLHTHLQGATTLIIAPDGPLHALPFDALLDEKSQPLIQAYAIRMLQTGRDLVARDRVATGKGLVAFGGIDFGRSEKQAEIPATTSTVKTTQAAIAPNIQRSLAIVRGELGPFKMLVHSSEEVDAIGKLYRNRRTDEPVPVIYKGLEATEARLKQLDHAPRVLHLATHGFFLGKGSVAGQPLLQSGVALASANTGIAGTPDADGENGVLQAIEAQNLNLFGTELVVLSACQTGQGVVDYSEGLEGLPRAFYVAGAKNVLVTLWNVGDESTTAFMTEFYDRWTLQAISDPATALNDTKKFFMSHPTRPDWRDPQIWSAFVLYEG